MKRVDATFAIKSLTDDGSVSGYASVFDVEDAYKDVIIPGAFSATLEKWNEKKRFPPMLWQHKTDVPIGLYTTMVEDSHGLYVEGRFITETTSGRDAYLLAKAGVVNGMSIGYQTVADEYDSKKDVRILKQVDLWEVSLVTFPANSAAVVGEVRAAMNQEEPPTIRMIETVLRDAGLSKTQAKALLACGYQGVEWRRDAGQETLETECVETLIKVMRGA